MIDFEEKGQLKKSSVKKAASKADGDPIHDQGWRLSPEIEVLKTFPETIEDLISRLEAAILNDLGFDYGRFVTSQEKAQNTLKESILIRERAGFDQSAPFYNLGWIFTRQGQWKDAEECFQKALIESGEASQATYRGDIGCLYELQENYAQAEMELLYRLEVLDRQQRSHNLFGYTGIAQNYALSGNDVQSRHYLEKAYTLFEEETRPRRKWWCLYVYFNKECGKWFP